MPDDLADDLQSLSFGSSGRTTDTTASSSSSGSAPTSGPISSSSSGTAAVASSGGHANGHASSASCCCCTNSVLQSGQAASASPALRMSDLRFLRRLGSGDIGTVYLAQLDADSSSSHGFTCRRCGGTAARAKQQQQPQSQARLLAAKVMDKEELHGRNKQGRAKAELEILKMLDHPFLPKLVASVQDDRWACLLTDFCPGGDLHVLRQRQPHKRFTEAAVRFYAAEVVVALEYLHMLGVVYRDLKPENVLVRADGHIMLTDFDLSLRCDDSASAPRLLGLPSSSDERSGVQTVPVLLNGTAVPSSSGGGGLSASCILPSCIVPAVSCFNNPNGYGSNKKKKKQKKKKPKKGCADLLEFVAEPVGARSMSFVGTHEYLAPEIVSGEGHGSAVDWWTLGVLLFELLYGYTPFRGPDNDMTLANIVARALEFPKESGGGKGDRKGAGRRFDCGPPVVSQQVKDLISGLLVKDPARRLGSATGAPAVKRHPFFHGVNWALLRCAKPPPVPPPLPDSFFPVDHRKGPNPDGSASCDDDDEREDNYTSSSAGSMVNRCSSSGGHVSHINAAVAAAKPNTSGGSSVGVVLAADGTSTPASPVDYY